MDMGVHTLFFLKESKSGENFANIESNGGINRLKEHIAGIGVNVQQYSKVKEEDKKVRN